MNEDQSYEDNRADFIARLIAEGWAYDDAVEEWENIQSDEEGTP